MTLTNRQYIYDVISLLLTGARSNSAQGLTKKINSITVLTLNGGTLSLRLNSTSNKSITLADNMKIEGTPITEIYWTNTAQPGLTAQIYIVWID